MGSILAYCILSLSFTSITKAASLVTLEAVEWKYLRKLYDYQMYGAITLERVELPPHTLMVNLTINAQTGNEKCSSRKVNIYANQYGIPVVSRDKEVFPKNAYTPKSLPNITITTNNRTNEWVLSNFREGSLFVMAIMPHDDTRIRQQGLFTSCDYFISIRALITYYTEESIPILANGERKSFELAGNTRQLISAKLPLDTTSYKVNIEGCKDAGCKAKFFLWQSLNPGMWSDTSRQVCKGACDIEEIFPITDSFVYIGVDLLSSQKEVIRLTLTLKTCTKNNLNETKSVSLSNDVKTECVLPLGRDTPSHAAEGSNFQDLFVVWNQKNAKPPKFVSVKVPADAMSVLRFKLRSSDSGATLNIELAKPGKSKSKSKQSIELMLCASLSRIVLTNNCSRGATLRISSDMKEKEKKVLVPYPQTGTWYVSMQSRCYNTGSNATVPCLETPQANVTISLSSCVDGGCGQYGSCKIYSSADLLYSACNCHSGWRGYGCNDGSKADSLTEQKIAVYLLTLSNLAFLPGICLALHRRFFTEAFVYSFNMFFSTFYHACDSSYVYRLCIWPFGTLIFADFFASLMSFAVTLLAMARIPASLRTVLHIVAAMFVAVGEVHNRHGLFQQLMPIASGLAIVIVSWGYEMYRRKILFPSKYRYIKFIIPGLLLATVGLCLNLLVETIKNYKYVHSAWHVLVASAIVFLLPPRPVKKWDSQEQPLSIQSGDVISSTHNAFMNNADEPSYQNAGDPNPTPVVSESTALNNNSNFLMTNRSRGRENYVL